MHNAILRNYLKGILNLNLGAISGVFNCPSWWTTVWCTSTNFQLQILHQIFRISYFHKFYKSFEKNLQRSKMQICGMSIEIFDCLKCEQDINITTTIVLPRQKYSLYVKCPLNNLRAGQEFSHSVQNKKIIQLFILLNTVLMNSTFLGHSIGGFLKVILIIANL